MRKRVYKFRDISRGCYSARLPEVVVIDETGLKVEDIHLWFWFIIDPEKQKTVARDHLTLYGLSLFF